MNELLNPESRWPSAIALLAVGLLHWTLPDAMNLGPPWLLLAIVAALLVPTSFTFQLHQRRLNAVLGFLTLGIITAFVTSALVELLRVTLADTPDAEKHHMAGMLLQSALALWATNLLLFASWYWRLDAGGPHARHERGAHREGAILFPQMTMGDSHWRPQFIDYLFVAFNTSTAFSPTDAPVLSRWAKVLMMVQSTISLTTLAVLVGRGINML